MIGLWARVRGRSRRGVVVRRRRGGFGEVMAGDFGRAQVVAGGALEGDDWGGGGRRGG